MADESILFRMEQGGQAAPRLRLRALDGDEAVPASPSRARYERVGEIARGGVGVVHKARDVDLGRDVAIKVLRERHLDASDIVERFVEEAQIGGQLQHPGIVPVYELGLDEGGRPFFAMKLVKGETLASLLTARKDPSDDQRRILAIFGAVCRTVAYAHSRGIVHRDLKPANVMIGTFGEVQVVDWGFAKVLARGGVADERRSRRAPLDVTRVQTVRSVDAGSDSIAGSVFGTPAYMPPEQALGHVEELDERSDVFALGAILCEILTGAAPYTGTAGEIMGKALHCELGDAFSRLDACGADAELVDLCRQALAPVPKERPRNAAIVSEAIAGYLAGIDERAHRSKLAGIHAREQAARARHEADEARAAAETQQRRRRQTVAWAGVGLAILLVGTGLWTWHGRTQDERRGRIVAAVDEALQEASGREGAGDFASALAALERARDLAATEDAPADLRREVGLRFEATQAGIRGGAGARRAPGGRRRLASRPGRCPPRAHGRLRLPPHRGGLPSSVSRTRHRPRHADAGRGGGGDPRADRPGGHRGRPRRLGHAAPDEGGTCGRTCQGTASVAGLADPDPWRDRLRDAVASRNADRLRALAAEADIETLPVRTLDLLGMVLGESDKDAGIDLLRRVHDRHPADLWIHHHLARLARPALEGGPRGRPAPHPGRAGAAADCPWPLVLGGDAGARREGRGRRPRPAPRHRTRGRAGMGPSGTSRLRCRTSGISTRPW